ncbi:MAG: DUF3489 domain-containing protein [Hyphomicrobiaceae bacterium]
MSTASIETSPKSKRVATKKVSDQRKSTSPTKSASIGKPAKIEASRSEGRITKQERVLELLTRSSGASIEEIMKATAWQQHSVRGFLAGTVKKKLGLDLASSKAKDEVRRYRILARRGR